MSLGKWESLVSGILKPQGISVVSQCYICFLVFAEAILTVYRGTTELLQSALIQHGES